MAVNRVQFQPGLSMAEFLDRYGSEAQCAATLGAQRWPEGFRCPRCAVAEHFLVSHGARKLYQCRSCRHQASLTAGTLIDSTKLPLCTWFLAMYLIGQAKTGLSALALMRHLGTSYRTAWLVHQKVMRAMAQRDSETPLKGTVQLDDAYLGGECRGARGRASPNKVPFVAAVSTNDAGRSMFARLSPISGFTTKAVADWARLNLVPVCDVRSDGLSCFGGVIDAGGAHSFIVAAGRKPRDLRQFKCVNTVLANLKTMISGRHKSFKFGKYAGQYLGAFCFRSNRRFDLRALVPELIAHTATFPPVRERAIRGLAEVHD